jgi:hypothetical protein
MCNTWFVTPGHRQLQGASLAGAKSSDGAGDGDEEICVHAWIEVTSDDGDQLAVNSLFRWLLRDRDARRDASFSLETRGPVGEMGALEVINVLLAEGTGFLNLAVAIAAWRESRQKPAAVTVIVNDRSVTLAGEAAEDTQHKLQVLVTEAMRVDPTSATGDRSTGDNEARE